VRQRREQESDPSALAQEGASLLAAGDAAGAAELLRRAATALPDSELVWFNLGLAAARLEEWSTAETAFARASEINPDRADSSLQRGIALQKLGKCEEAVAACRRALERDAGLTSAHYYLSICYSELGDAAAAAEHLRLYDASR
jgi:tetratricopeptide (TPR) repeat protein